MTTTTTTEQPRGSVAKRLQESIRRGDITLNTTPDNIIMFVAVLLGPVHGRNTAIVHSHQHQHHQRRLTLFVKDRPDDDMAPPGSLQTRQADAGGLPLYEKGPFR